MVIYKDNLNVRQQMVIIADAVIGKISFMTKLAGTVDPLHLQYFSNHISSDASPKFIYAQNVASL